MTHDADILLERAAEALKNKQYPAAEELQRRGCQLLREQRAEEPRIANEIEKLADIHCAQRKFDLCADEYADVVRMREKFLPARVRTLLEAKSASRRLEINVADAVLAQYGVKCRQVF